MCLTSRRLFGPTNILNKMAWDTKVLKHIQAQGEGRGLPNRLQYYGGISTCIQAQDEEREMVGEGRESEKGLPDQKLM